MKKKIEELMDRNLAESRKERIGETAAATAKFKQNASTVEELVRQVMPRLENELTGTLVFDALSRSINELGLPEGWAGEVFARVATAVRLNYGDQSRFLPELNRAGIDYFKSIYKTTYGIGDEKKAIKALPKITRKVGDELNKMDFYEIKEFDVDNQRFQYKALKEIQIELEHEGESKEEKKKNPENFVPRNAKQVFIALSIILDLLRATRNQENKAKFMSFLSGYSFKELRQYFSGQHSWKDRGEIYEYVRDICKEFGLPVVSKEFDKEIANLDKKTQR